MRSRYSAFVTGDSSYLKATWHPSTRPRKLDLDPLQRWIRLDILSRTKGGMFDTEGTVEFSARYRLDGEAHEHHEVSMFVRDDKRWSYLSPA